MKPLAGASFALCAVIATHTLARAVVVPSHSTVLPSDDAGEMSAQADTSVDASLGVSLGVSLGASEVGADGAVSADAFVRRIPDEALPHRVVELPDRGGAPPPGYHRESHRNSAWSFLGGTMGVISLLPPLGMGLVGLGHQYVACVTTLSTTGTEQRVCVSDPLAPMALYAIPIVGPIVGGALLERETGTSTMLHFGVAISAFQLASVGSLLLGLTRQSSFVRSVCDTPVSTANHPSWWISPGAGTVPMGLTLTVMR